MEGKNKMKGEVIVGILIILLFFGGVIFTIIDEVYKLPQAAEKANQICQEKGFDYYDDFERIGFLSNNPVAIKCKYVENYQEMDIALKQYYGGSVALNEE